VTAVPSEHRIYTDPQEVSLEFVDEDDDAENENDADSSVHAGRMPFRDSI